MDFNKYLLFLQGQIIIIINVLGKRLQVAQAKSVITIVLPAIETVSLQWDE